MNGQQHIIKKFSLELQTQGREHSYALQRSCIKMVNEGLVDGIDEILSTRFTDDDIVRINKIEIDLGDLTVEELETHFVDKCIAEFTRTIKKIPGSKKQRVGEEIITVSKEENCIAQFVLFLLTGKIYWAEVNRSFAEWQTLIIDAIKNNPGLLTQQLDEALKNRVTIERLVAQFDHPLIQLLVQVYQPHIKKEFDYVMELLQRIFSQNKDTAPGKDILVELLIVLFKPPATVDKIDFENVLQRVSASSKNVELTLALQLKEACLALFEKLNSNTAITVKNDPTNEILIEKITANVNAADGENENEITEAPENCTYINNAGLVILHPFLQNFFDAAGLLQDDHFSSDFAAKTAVHLLQYLANGEQQAPEYIMPLNKILCGINDEQHVDRFIQLDETQLKEAVALLEAVVVHWEILKNTSVEGLQETFFQRKGKLNFNATDGFWKLQVERKALDILLDKIPWGISYIKLPWMNYPLVTEW